MKKILLIRLSSLGDIVILSSTLEYLKKRALVDIVLYEQFADLFIDDPRIRKIIAIPRTNSGKIKAFKRIREEKYDVVIDCHKKLYTILLSLAAKTKKKISIKKNGLERRFAVWFKKEIIEKPLYITYLEPLITLFKEEKYPIPKLVSMKKPAFDIEGEYAVFVPGASKNTKKWPLEYFLQLAEMVYKKFNIRPVFVDSQPLNIKHDFLTDFGGKTNLRELAYILDKAEFVVSNDTGPAHMAAAVSTPLFVIFGSTIPQFGFRPVSEAPVFLFERKLRCRPCSLHGKGRCPRGDLLCLKDIKPEEVFKKIEEFLSWKNL